LSEMPHNSRRHRSRSAAKHIGMSSSWLAKRRMAGLPPAYLKLGKSVIYDEDELDRFLATCRRRSTSESDQAEQKNVNAPPGPRVAREPNESKVSVTSAGGRLHAKRR
jgi:hypothetical protein